MRSMLQISYEVGAVMVTSPASPVASGAAIMTAQNGQPRCDCCCLTFIGHYYVFMILYLYTENYYRVLHAYHCSIHAGLRLVRYRSEAVSIGPVQERFWHVGARPYGHEESNEDKITLVAFQASLLGGGSICDSGKLALADISTRSTSTEGRDLPWCRLGRRWWHRRLLATASGAVGGGGPAPWWLSLLQCPNHLLRIHCM